MLFQHVGFCIRITPNDRRTACVFYRVGSRLRRATLGTLPPLSLADARQLAREVLREAALGHDPASAKREAREALTVAVLVRAYIEAGEGRRSAATNGDYRRTLKAAVRDSPIGQQAAGRSPAVSFAPSWKPSPARRRFEPIASWRSSARRFAGPFGKN